MAGSEAPIIIIRRKRKKGAEGHHGGAWKVAYADFVTAMMAFFLLLWLLNVTTDEQRHGIADYFTPASIARSESGAGGAMGGLTITAPGAMISHGTPPVVYESTIPTSGKGEAGEAEISGDMSEAHTTMKDHPAAGETAAMTKAAKAAAAKNEAAENASFQAATEALMKAIQNSPTLKGLSDQLLIEQTPEGLRIQIIDKDNSSMFPSGSALLYEKSRALLRLVGTVVSRLPNPISVAGHTDGAGFTVGSRRDNWTLSTERANVCRQVLMEADVAPERIARVIGMADREPLDINPNGAKNRRISLTLLRMANRETKAVVPTAPTAPITADHLDHAATPIPNAPSAPKTPPLLALPADTKPNGLILPSVLPSGK
jgi:chemotaxis protein MotB